MGDEEVREMKRRGGKSGRLKGKGERVWEMKR